MKRQKIYFKEISMLLFQIKNKTPSEVRQEALSSDVPTEYPIPENKRISKYKEKWCA